MKLNIEIKELQPINVIACRHIGPYSEICNAFAKLGQWAAEKGLFADAPKMMGIYHDEPCSKPADQLRSDACIEDKGKVEPGEGMQRYTISGGKYFVVNVETTMADFGEAWNKAYKLLEEKGLEWDTRDNYELYLNDPGNEPDAVWLVDLCIPIK